MKTTRALSQNVTNAPIGALTPSLKNAEVKIQNKLHFCKKFSGQNSSMKINKELQKYDAYSYGSCALHFSSMRSICLWNLKSVAWILFELYAPDKIQEWKWTKGNNSESMKLWVMVLVHCTSPHEIYLLMKFQVSSLNTFWVMLRTKVKNENKQRTITPKVWYLELWFLCTALPLMRYICLWNFKSAAWILFQLYSDKIQELKWTKGNDSKSMMSRVMVLVHCTYPQ